MLIWTAPSEGAGTSHRRHPGGDGDSVFTSRTSSPMKAYAGQARDISWECRVWSGGQQEGWGCRREETVCTWLGESAESREASELTEEDGEVGSTLVWISVGGRRHKS